MAEYLGASDIIEARGEAVDAACGYENLIDSLGEGTSIGLGWRVAAKGIDFWAAMVEAEILFAGLRVRLPLGSRKGFISGGRFARRRKVRMR